MSIHSASETESARQSERQSGSLSGRAASREPRAAMCIPCANISYSRLLAPPSCKQLVDGEPQPRGAAALFVSAASLTHHRPHRGGSQPQRLSPRPHPPPSAPAPPSAADPTPAQERRSRPPSAYAAVAPTRTRTPSRPRSSSPPPSRRRRSVSSRRNRFVRPEVRPAATRSLTARGVAARSLQAFAFARRHPSVGVQRALGLRPPATIAAVP